MKILVINTGSSSIKYQVFDINTMESLCCGLVERIGLSNEIGKFTHKQAKHDVSIEIEKEIPDHKAGMEEIVKILQDDKIGLIKDISQIQGVGHRIVHGGRLRKTEKVSERVINELSLAIPLAPLHNPASILGIEISQEIFHKSTHVVVLDTSYHRTIPIHNYMYGLPYKYYNKLKVRKYGFHGTSHKYVIEELGKILNKEVKEITALSIHLGNGSSITAIKNGKSIDTSMGFTPLDGLMMGTRCGSIDSSIIKYLSEMTELSLEEIDEILHKESGFLGITGYSDLRTIEEQASNGNKRCKLGLEMLCNQLKGYIGNYIAKLGQLPEAIIFTAGIGENSSYVREHTLKDMKHLGIELDLQKNKESCVNFKEISKPTSKVKVYIIKTNEELEIAKETLKEINKKLR